MIKLIEENDVIYAKIIRANHIVNDCEFFTSETDELQFGIVNYKKNYKTGAHYHNHSQSKKTQTDEILVFLQGGARIDFYNNEGSYIKSSEAFCGDIVIFFKGGHNLFYYDDTKVYMIKSGAYVKKSDKTRIIGTNNLELFVEND